MRFVLFAAATFACAATAHAEQPFDPARTSGQLPKTVVPSAYRIDLVADIARRTLRGHVSIDVAAAAGATAITLNQAGLTLARATIDGSAALIAQDDAAQTATLRRAAGGLAAGTHVIEIDYSGPIPFTPNGIYLDAYRTEAGAARQMLVTQFEVADARRMLPCWDEPAFKATFQLTATLPKSYVAVSNMNVAATTPSGRNRQQIRFAVTPRMSSYLLALFAGDLGALHGSGGGTPISLYAPRGTQADGAYALHAAQQVLPYYNDYFGVPYPLPKLDLIAVPGNYEAGAMENWGAISFIDNALLFDPARSAAATREEIYLTVAHEMAHQWSGDLVTMGWWDDIWLNEGFATWMENKATDHFNPSWQIWPRQHETREAAMAVDALPTTHPIHLPIHDTSEADAAFDEISYQKGSQIIRMIEDWLGPENFENGLRAYMRRHAYGNTTGADLWAALGQVTHRDVAPVAISFTDQPGIPLVDVARACEGGQTVLRLSQSRFTLSDPNPAKLAWSIPISAGFPGIATQKTLLEAAPATLRFPGCGAAIKVNLGENGYYRTRYDHAGLAALAAGFAQLSPADRADLLGDQFALAQAGLAPLADYLDLAARISPADGFAVVTDTIDHLTMLDALARGEGARDAFRARARAILAPLLARLGLDPIPNEGFLDTRLRPLLVAALGRFGDPAIIAPARQRVARFLHDPSSLPPELAGPLAAIAVRAEGAALYDRLEAMVRNAPDTEAKLRYFGAMAAAHDPALVARSIRFAYSGAMPNGRIVGALHMVATGSDDPALVWRLGHAQQAAIRPHLAPISQTELLPALLGDTADRNLAEAMLADPQSARTSGAKLQAHRAAVAIGDRADLRARLLPQLSAWLDGAPGATQDPDRRLRSDRDGPRPG